MWNLPWTLSTQTLTFPGGSATFPIDSFNKTCLLNDVDELGYLLGFEKEIAAFENRDRRCPGLEER